MVIIKLTWDQYRELTKLILFQPASRFSKGRISRDYTGSEFAWDKDQVVISLKERAER